MNNIIVVDARPQDAPAIRDVSRLSWLSAFPNEAYGIIREDIQNKFAFKTEEDKERLLEDRRKKIMDPMWHYWVAKDGGKVVGFCIARKGEDNNELVAIHLLPEYHGKGIGKQMFQKALEWLGAEKQISLGVAVYNQKTIRFYEKFGFKKKGEKPPNDITTLPSGKFIPQIEMVLKF